MILKELAKILKGKVVQGNFLTKIKKFSTDTRTLKKDDVFIALKGENFDGHSFLKQAIEKKARGVIVSKVPSFLKKEKIFILKVKNTLEALGFLGSFFRDKFKGKVVAVTGSNGKTTTKEMIAKILEAKFKVLKAPKSFNNLVGIPLTLINLKPSFKVVVLELGANHKGEIKKLAKISKPEIAIITNIGKAHIGLFGSQQKIFSAKKEILKSPKIKTLVINYDDPFLRKIKFRKKIGFSIQNPSDFQAKIIKEELFSTTFEIKNVKIKLPLSGRFNVYNALAGIAVGSLFGVSLKLAKKQLERYKTLPLRSQILRIKKATVFLDCYNANPTSVGESLKVLEKFPQKKVIVFGDMLELGRYAKKEHQEVGKILNKMKPLFVICVGKLARYTFGQLKGIKKFWFEKPSDAQKIINTLLNKNVIILIKGSRKIQMEKVLSNPTFNYE